VSRPTEGGKPLDYNCACGGGRAQEIRQQEPPGEEVV
jgi:hypothetical protein